MSAPRTKRRSSPATRLMKLLLVLAGAAALLWLIVRLTGRDKEAAAISPTVPPAQIAAAVQSTQPPAQVFQTAPPLTPTPVPTPSPEPLPKVDVNDWSLRLIRYEYPLGEDFAPPSLTDVGDGQQVDSRIAPALTALMDAAKAAGYTVYVCSGYRDYDTQSWIYWNHIEKYEAQGMTEEEADAATRLAVNYPGTSEHQSGLAVDLLEYAGQDMEPYIGGSGLMLWLEQHCADYGFVIRYPNGLTDLTGVEYEPWHLRYVGNAAPYIMRHGLCLEQFLGLYE